MLCENSLFLRFSSLAGAAVCLIVSLQARADSGSWTGAESAAWTNSANWSAAPFPAGSDTATFNGAGNGNTVIDLSGLASILNVTFDTPTVAAYTLGSGGANGQSSSLENGGTVALGATAANSQTVDVSVVLGTNTAAATYTFRNDSTLQDLVFSGAVSGAGVGGTAGVKTLDLKGYGRILLNGVLSSGGATRLDLNSYGTNSLSGNNTFTGNVVVLDGTLRITHSNALGAGAKTITAANNVGGRNPSIVLDGSAGDLTIPSNVTFNTSQSRAGAVINEAGNNTILGNFTLTSGDGATHLWSKGGKLTITGTLRPTATDRALYLRGDADGEISGAITNGSTSALPIYRDVGTGTWILSGVNTFSGATTVSAGSLVVAGTNGTINASSSITISGGASLVVSNTASANQANRVKDSASVALASGTLSFVNDGTAANFAENVGVVTLSSGSNTVSASQAAEGQTSALTLSGLSRSGTSTVNFIGAGLGQSDRNRIFITGQADGVIGSWALVNGTEPAFYSTTRGVYQPALIIAAKGDVLVDGSEEVVIETEGSGGPDELSAAVTAVGSLYQNSAYTSTVNTAEKILRVDKVTIYPSMSDLTLGVSTNDGSVTPAATGGELALVNNSVSGTLTVNASIADNGSSSSLSKSGAGLVLLTGSSTYSGQTWVRAGTLGVATIGNVSEAGSLGQPPTAELAAIKLGSLSTNAYLRYTGPGETANRAIDMAGTTGNAYIDQAGAGLLKLSAPAVLTSGSGSKSLVLQGDTDGVGELAGVIGDSASGATTLVKLGSGTWRLSAENTFTGLTDIRKGTLSLTHPRALASSSMIQMTTAPGGTLSLDNDANNEPAQNVTLGVNCPDVTLALGAGTNGQAVTHVFNDWSFSRVTATVSRSASVLSGTPSVTVQTLNLSSGGTGDTRLRASGTDVQIGSAAIRSGSYAKTLILDGDTHANTITGAVANGLATFSLQKDGAGSWTLSGSNTYSGVTTINAGVLAVAGANGSVAGTSGFTLNGGALRLANAPAANHTNRLADTKGLTMAGGTLDFSHSADDADYSETVGAMAVTSGGSTISASQAAAGHTSALTLSSLTRTGNGTLDFTGTGLGDDTRNRILIANQPDGLIGFWSAYNGTALALYDSARGVYGEPSTIEQPIAARGPSSVVPSNTLAAVRITEPGSTGPATLEGAPYNPAFSILQTTAIDSVIDVAGKTLATHGIGIASGAASLTVGVTADEGVLTALAPGGKVELSNDSTSVFTNNAALGNNAGAVSLGKSGSGDVILNGACSYSGDTVINAGSLIFASSVTQALVGAISGAGNLVKVGTNRLTLAGRNTYTGVTYINEGIVLAQTNQAFGANSAGTIIASGATLDVGANRAANTLNLGSEPFTVSGSGVGGKGAIVNNSGTSQYGALGQVTMVGDTTFGGAQSTGRFDIRNNTPTLNMNSYTLTKVGPNMFGLTSATVNPGTGSITVAEGTLRFESNTKMNGSATNTVTLRGGSTLELYQHYPQNACKWSLLCDDNVTLSAMLGGPALSNNWAGPITLGGTLKVTGNGNFHQALSGVISGPGSIVKYGATTTYLTNDFNTYSGYTWITNGTVYVSSIRPVGAASSSLGAPADVATGTIRLGADKATGTLAYTGAGDTTDRPIELAGNSGGSAITHAGTGLLKFTANAVVSGIGTNTLTLSASAGSAGEFAGSISNSPLTRVPITKNGAGAWTLSGNNGYTGDVNIAAGTLTLTATNAQGPGAITVGSGSGNTVLNLTPTTVLTGSGGIRVGSASGSQAAMTMSGGTVNRTPKTGDDLAFTLGRVTGSYGGFLMSAGDLTITRIQTGASSKGTNCVGVFRMTGGVATFKDYILLARGTNTLSAFTLDGGTVFHTNAAQNISLGYEGGRAELNLTGGMLESYGRNLTVRQNIGNPTGIVNLCAGLLSVDLFQNTAPGVALLNFAGGTLKAGSVSSPVFVPANMSGVYTYGPFGTFSGGAVIDTLTRTNSVMAPIQAPAGNGVYSIALADQGSGYIGEPYVSIEGDGLGATAVANMSDDGSGNGTYCVSSVTVTCPGVNYTTSPSVRFIGGGSAVTAPTVSTVKLSANSSGGLTKLGAGMLTLGAANTYTGTTTVAAGTLKLGVAGALPTQTQVVLAGGTLDLSGFTVTNTLAGSGLITNGTVQTVLSPAGEGALGTNTLALASSSLQGTYMADVTASGDCDLVNIQGNINLGNFALQLVDPGALNPAKVYTVLTHTGTRTGTFSSVNLPNSRWHVLYSSSGAVQLRFAEGTLLKLN